ncbi:DHA2 family efflux MFS transporter permease subunit [Rummeliibacillus sp. TYF005]|uniref:DHA2 family efflux MFS transporter permease subunit n=1 Tax=Rummeliibacillus sp. TYF005 TaxID=2058214 RepID=UPI000F52563E|nr:DHA2 family efflux MFS transporter permease subunit [Rummeliibacillus sp. TYF005]RPJ95746.1 DHA2 family efflux MFS transporter permease subunit [Rummeliibacillus sp. TYF005]
MGNETLKKPPYAMLAILFIGAFVAFLNNTLMNVALPTIMNDFKVTYSQVQWLTTGFMLVSGILIPASAFFVVKFKNRSLFIVAMSLFTIGTIIAAAAPNFWVLIAGRMVQAAGSAALSPLLMNVMLVSFPIEKRGSAMGMFGLVMIAAPAIGPTLSGYIVEHHSWRMLFEMIIPFAVLSLLFGLWKLENVMETRKVSLDYTSLVLSTIGFGGLLYGFSSAGDKGFNNPLVYSSIAIGAVTLVIFIIKQVKMEEPLLDERIYKYPMFALGSAISMVISVAMFSGMILTPAYVQQVRGISPFHAGLMMLPGAIIMALMSPITGRLFDKIGPRILAFIGLSIITVSSYFLTKLQVDSSYAYIITVYTIRMLGMSMVMMPIMTNGLNQLPMEKNPHGTAINNTVQQVSGAIGTAILVTIMDAHIKTKANDLVAEMKAKAAKTAKAAMEAGQKPSTPTTEQMVQMKAHITQTALLSGINYTFMVVTGISAVALILSLFLKRVKVNKAVQKPQMGK